jgi:hypothetical protein
VILVQVEPDNAELTAAGVVEDYMRMPARGPRLSQVSLAFINMLATHYTTQCTLRYTITLEFTFLLCRFWKRYEAKAGDSRAKLALLAVARRSVWCVW